MSMTLYYFHDPMCSWCWGFRPSWIAITEALPETIQSKRILGGLAPDNEQPMPMELQIKLQDVWKKIQQTIPGTEFNFDFWQKCVPRRSTYAACRAVIAAKKQDMAYEEAMILAIQQAYYLNAKNPADLNTLIDLADDMGLDVERFTTDILSPTVNQELIQEIEFAKKQDVKGFPTLLLEKQGIFIRIMHDYENPSNMIREILKQST